MIFWQLFIILIKVVSKLFLNDLLTNAPRETTTHAYMFLVKREWLKSYWCIKGQLRLIIIWNNKVILHEHNLCNPFSICASKDEITRGICSKTCSKRGEKWKDQNYRYFLKKSYTCKKWYPTFVQQIYILAQYSWL